jgi:hypothetical protein
MNMKKNVILLIAVSILSVLILSLTSEITSASRTDYMAPPSGFGPMMRPAGMCADQQYLYAVAGGKIMQYSLSDMSLVRSVDLPELPPPPDAGTCQAGNCPPPPPMARSQWLLTAGGSLYVMIGPMIYRYSTPDLGLLGSVELPKPEFP